MRCALVTVSNTLTEETDRCGSLSRKRFRGAGHEIVLHEIVPDKASVLRRGIEGLVDKVDVVLFNGGAGAGRPGDAHEVLEQALKRTFPGFGERFRHLAVEDRGPQAMLLRATAGTIGHTLFFSVPGTLADLRLALDELILPDLKPLVWETVRRDQTGAS